jgi:iron uptake system component EfeO
LAIRVCLALAAVGLLGVSGCGSDAESSADVAKRTAAATEEYRSYLLGNAEHLTTWASQLRHKMRLGVTGGAQSRYASSRVPFGHLQPALNFYPKLDQRLDAPQTGAFPRIERMLWEERLGRAGLRAAGEILDSTLWLHEEIKTTKLPPAQIMAVARHTLRQIASSDLQLEADPYSGLDILDASADLEGVEAAFKAVRPSLLAEDPDLVEELNRKFNAAFVALEAFGTPAKKLAQPRPSSPGTSFVISDPLPPEELLQLRDSVDRLRTLLAAAVAAT